MSNLPITVQDDQPPLLRFINDAVEDRFMSEKEGKICFKDIIKVYVRAHGDTKSETPFIAKDVKWVEEITDGKTVHKKVVIYPWIDQLDEKLKDNQCSGKFHESCVSRFKKFEATGEILVEGTPIATWNQITPAQQKQVMNAQILSVEQLAEATEEAMTEIGMGARELKKKANTYLNSHNKDSEVIKAQDKRILDQAEQLSELEKKIAELIEIKEKQAAPSNLAGLRAELDTKGIKYHHMAGEKKLQSLLAESEKVAA